MCYISNKKTFLFLFLLLPKQAQMKFCATYLFVFHRQNTPGDWSPPGYFCYLIIFVNWLYLCGAFI
jgi:hypothetical protein